MDEPKRGNGGFVEFIEVEVVNQRTRDDHEFGREGNWCRVEWRGRARTFFCG